MNPEAARFGAIARVLPSLLVFFLLFFLPISYFFVISFWRVRSFQLHVDATLDQYREVFRSFAHPLLYTLAVALAIALTTTLLAFAYAYFCRFKTRRWGTALVFMALLTLFGGYLTKIYMWKTILGSAGLLNSAMLELGIITEPVTILLYNLGAVIITLVHYTLPLAILPIYGALRGIDDVPLEAARDVGASRSRVFFDIILPQCQLGILSAFALTFIFAAGDYVTPLMVGGPSTSMIGLFIQSQFGARLNSPLGSAMSFSVIASSGLVIFVVGALLHNLVRPRD
jgi:spermidine/putrescine transport system permease protein